MAIDPKMYEKYSGRSGDPYTRLGEALSQNVKHQHRRTAAKDMSAYERSLMARAKMKVVWWVIVSVLGLGALIWRSLS